MASMMKYLSLAIYVLTLLSTTYSDMNRCECTKKILIVLCASCTPGCWRRGTDCLPCPEHCVNCKNSTYCSTCAPGHWGKICEKKCHSDLCKENLCSRDTGRCIHGCVEGKFGLEKPAKTCKKCPRNCLTCNSEQSCDKCLSGFSGRDCRFRCNNCIDGLCNKDGCTKGCMSGYFPSTSFTSRFNVPPCFKCPDSCSTCTSFSDCLTCMTGFYGRGCQYKCDECQNGLCNKTGCLEGCADRYFREPQNINTSYCSICPETCATCSSKSSCKTCLKGLFGKTCHSRCDLNCIEDVCNTTNGICLHGCSSGFYQETNECIPCPPCSSHELCQTENCQAECCQVMTSSFTCAVDNCRECVASLPDNCNTCNKGFFKTRDDKCNVCSEGCKGAKCEEIGGRCLEGCKDGWSGKRCEVKCLNHTCFTGGAMDSGNQSKDTYIILGAGVGGGIFVSLLVAAAVVIATVRRRRLRLSSAGQSDSQETQDPTTTNQIEMTSPTYEDVDCHRSLQYEDLGARNEHIYMHGVAEEQYYIN